MIPIDSKIRTNVRIAIVLGSVLLTGCVTSSTLVASGAPRTGVSACAADGMLICERFVRAEECECKQRQQVRDQLPSFGQQSATGF